MEIKNLINEDTVFHCNSEEKAREFIKKAHELGYHWRLFDGINNTHYSGYGNETCYRLHVRDKSITFGAVYCFRKRCLTIVEYELDTVEENKPTPIQYLMDYFSVKEGEEFNIIFKNGIKSRCSPYKFDGGVLKDNEGDEVNAKVGQLIMGEVIIEKLELEWKPNDYEEVWFVDIAGDVCDLTFASSCIDDLAMLKNGWLFKSKEEALANKERVLKEYAKVINNE